MVTHYPTIYHDRYGQEITTIQNDGHTLSVLIRDVTFTGSDFDLLEPVVETDSSYLATFTFYLGCLCACEIESDIPLLLGNQENVYNSILHMKLSLGQPQPHGGLDQQRLLLQLSFDGQLFTSRGMSGWFEDELTDIERMLPINTYFKACIQCAFSDYSPAGHGLFGGLACFRDHKAEYRAVHSKHALFKLWPKLTEYVQETYLCGEFEERLPGSGYRG